MTRRGMRWGQALGLFILAASALGGSAQALAQGDAKSIYEQAKTNPNQCEQIKAICRAASMDKKYRNECSDAQAAIVSANNRYLNKASEKLDSKSYSSAKTLAASVCELDPSITAKKKDLLQQIADAQAPVVVTPPTPPPALETPKQEPVKSAEAMPQPAVPPVSQPTPPVAPNNPSPPAQTSFALQQHPPVPQVRQPQNQQQPPKPNQDEENRKTVAALLDRARQAEGANDFQAALASYEAAKRIQPANPEIDNGVKSIQQKINDRPEEQAKVLSAAIKAFYRSNYTEAENSLVDYLGYSNPRFRGAAYFYLGATRLYKTVFEASVHRPEDAIQLDSVQKGFRQARSACYQPVDRFMSPIMSRAWSVSASTARCTR